MQPKIHFVHTTDWHLGYYQYNKVERFNDFYQAANKTVDKIIELNPDFVLHTGDIFHHYKPFPGAIRQTVKILKRLNEKNIPFYIIRGNHDGRDSRVLQRGGSIINLLKDLNLAIYIQDEVYSVDGDCDILGIGYYPGKAVTKKIDDILLTEEDFLSSERFKIIAFHAFVEGQLDNIRQISLKKISELGVDYVGIGHYHIPWNRPKLRIWAPGSTETTSTNDWNRSDARDGISMYSSIYEVKSKLKNNQWTQPEVEEHKILVRPKIQLEYSSKSNDLEEIKRDITEKLKRKKAKIIEFAPELSHIKPIVSLNIHTELSYEDSSKLSLSGLANELNFLQLSINIEGTDNFQSTNFVDNVTTNEIEGIISELSGLEKENSTKFLEITMDLVNELGTRPSSRDMDNQTFRDILELIETNNILLQSDKETNEKIKEKNEFETKPKSEQSDTHESKYNELDTLEGWF